MDLITLFSTLDPVIQLSIIGGIGTYFGILIAEQSEKINTNIILYQGVIFLVTFIIFPYFLNKLINIFEITLLSNIIFLIILKSMPPSKAFTVYYLFLFTILITPSYLFLNFEISIEHIFIFFVWLFNLSLIAIQFGKNTFKKVEYDIYFNNTIERKYLSKIEEDFVITSCGTYINKSSILQMVPILKQEKVNQVQKIFNWIHNNAIWILFYVTILFYLIVICLLYLIWFYVNS